MVWLFELLLLTTALYALFWFCGWGLSCSLLDDRFDAYRWFLAPCAGMVALAIVPIYFSVVGMPVDPCGWLVSAFFCCWSVAALVRRPQHLKIPAGHLGNHLLLTGCMAVCLAPAWILLLKTGYPTSTHTSYGAFATMPADYFIHHAFCRPVMVDRFRPITNLLSQVVNNKEYFGYTFLLACSAFLLHLKAYQVYLLLTAVVGSFLPPAVFLLCQHGFDMTRRQASIAAVLSALNITYLRWPVGGQLPITAGLLFLFLALAVMPWALTEDDHRRHWQCAFWTGATLSMYSVLLPYWLGPLLLYSAAAPLVLAERSHWWRGAVRRAAIVGLLTVLINPFTFVFLGLHVLDVLHTTSHYTHNVPGWIRPAELLGLVQHFQFRLAAAPVRVVLFLLACGVMLMAILGCVKQWQRRSAFFFCFTATVVALALRFYLTDFVYHFYKNAVVGTVLLVAALAVGLDRLQQSRRGLLRASARLLALGMVIAEVNTAYSSVHWRIPVVTRAMAGTESMTRSLPAKSVFLVQSSDPTEEAWLSYFLRDRRIRLNGSLEPWGFWILSPFTGEPKREFFYDPQRDRIDYTLSHVGASGSDIVSVDSRRRVCANNRYLLSRGIPNPYLYRGWYPVEGTGPDVYRWTKPRAEMLFWGDKGGSVVTLSGSGAPLPQASSLVKIALNGYPVDEFGAPSTGFRHSLAVDGKWLIGGANRLQVRVTPAFVPIEWGIGRDTRRLGILLKSVQVRAAEALDIHRPIDIGRPEAEKYLGDGWSHNEILPGGRAFCWVQGRHCSLFFYIASPTSLECRFRAHPFVRRKGEVQWVQIGVNGERVGKIVLDSVGWSDYAMILPRSLLKPGLNRLEMTFRYAAAPRDVSKESRDPRKLSAAFDTVMLRPVP